jgi:hypothetical protein
MTKPKAEMYDRNGNLIDNQIVPDGGRLRVPQMMMDAATIDIAEITRRAMANQQPPLHAPGFVPVSLTDAEIEARELARDQRKSKLSDAWRNPPAIDASLAKKDEATPATDSEARYAARDKRLENAWRGAA